MYLKEITSTGFKSFADKLTINLDGKITCIVGPNGSGKSNVVDAVRWVLGEQSVKSLRGDSLMSDIIFSGSKSRSPLNVASVSLIFDNSDHYLDIPYNEVSIKRRVYRSGESEYFLNGEKCRLKDITDLLMDSAVGRESFNIISQGEIGKILSNSPMDRRMIIENAAGVLKYKKRKEEAIRKLDRTKSNLDRVLDIINELEIQVEPLKEQSAKAEEYLSAKDKLENIEIALIASEIETINYSCIDVKEKIERINEQILSLSIKSSKDDASIIDDKNNLSKFNLVIRELNDKLLNLTRLEEQVNGEKNMLKERSKYNASDAKVHSNISTLNEELLSISNELQLISIDIDNLNVELKVLTDNMNDLEQTSKILKQKYDNELRDITFKKRELLELDQKIEVLNNFIESGGNLSSAVRAVLNNPRLKGVHNVLGNLVECDELYTKALEVALSSTKQFVVVDDEECAKSAVNYLKENNLGRATFFPITTIKPKGIDNDTLNFVEKDEGFIDMFSNLVRFDSKYYGIISNQLGNVIVVKDYDSANRISKNILNRYKIVTLDGSIFNVGGSISGGSLSVTKSVITEKRNLEELVRRKESITQVIIELDNTINGLSNEIRIKEDSTYNLNILLVSQQEKIRAKVSYLSELNKKADDTKKELNSLSHIIDSTLSKEEEEITKKYYEVVLEKEKINKEIISNTKSSELLSSKIEEMEAKNRLNNSESNKLEKELKELEISISKMDVKLDNYLKILSEDYEMTYEKARANYILEIDVNTARSEVNKYKSVIKNIGMVNLNSIEDYKRVSTRYEFLSTQRNDLLNAEDTLLEIISEMDLVMKEEFTVTFEKVRTEFKKVFKELFGGGIADLKLTDPDNILETGVDIVASPPGKTLKSITLLSGGEMTLTAISLVFAILNIRSVPFCIFDEIEAALDEANVDNFGKYLDHYKDKTQFLIITHKKKTMEYADTLYGITMQESGVSKLVSVKLDKIA